MPRVLMNFPRNKNWIVHFIEADCKTTIGRCDRFFTFATEEDFRAFVSRCNLEDVDKFNRSMAQWARGSNHANLTEEQYAKLEKASGRKPATGTRPSVSGQRSS